MDGYRVTYNRLVKNCIVRLNDPEVLKKVNQNAAQPTDISEVEDLQIKILLKVFS